jgi:outer membrane protein TolC
MNRFVVAMILLPAAASAQPGASLTLDQAIAQGLANSQRLAELQARQEAAGFAAQGYHDALLPTVALQGGYTRTNHVEEFSVIAPGPSRVVVYPDIPDNYRTRLDLQWPIYTGGRTDALIDAANAERTAVGKDLEAARADLRLEITRAFYAVLTAQDTEDVLRRSLDAADAHLRDVRSRLVSGLIPPNDVSSAEAQVSHQRVLAVEAANLRGVAEADLQRLTGAPPGPVALVDPAPPDNPQFARVTDSTAVADLIARALRARPERQVAAGRRRQRLRLRQPEPAQFSPRRRVGDVVGRLDQRDLDALGRRPARRGNGRSARQCGGAAHARPRLRSPGDLRSAPARPGARVEPAGGHRRRRRSPRRVGGRARGR